MEITEQEMQQLKQQLADQAAAQDAFKEGLDKALAKLDEMAKPKPEVKPEVKAEVKVEPKVEPKKEEDPEDPEAEAFIKRTEEDHGKLEKLYEGFNKFMVRQELVGLKAEVNEAKAKFMNADEKEILLALQMDPNQNVMKLAEISHNKFLEKTKAMQTEIEAKVKEQLKKETEGGHSIPQGSGNAPTPQPRNPLIKTEEDEWAKALQASKTGLTG